MVDVLDAAFAPVVLAEVAAAALPDQDNDGELILPVPHDAPEMPASHFELGLPTSRWVYRNADDATLFVVVRFDTADGGKEFWPLTLWRNAEGLRWRWKNVPAPRPLYNLNGLAARPDAPVIICEGEKPADAAARIFPEAVATTSPNGAKAAEKADWAVLRGREVLIWPDDDQTGRDYADAVAATLNALDCRVSVMDAAKLAKIAPDGGERDPTKAGWDAADAINEWRDKSALRRAANDCLRLFEPACAEPNYVSFDKFEMDAQGLFYAKPRKSDGEVERIRVSAPFEILGRGRNPEGKGWGKFLRWNDPDGRTHKRFVAAEVLHGQPAALCAPLACDGLDIVASQHREFVNYLSGVETELRVTVVQRTGWHQIDGENVFVLPGQNIGSKVLGRVLLEGGEHAPYEKRGTLSDWRSGVGQLTTGQLLPMLSISAAFAGPLLGLAGYEGGGLNLFGQSSKGKTTCLQAAASVWGRGSTQGYVRSWRATANGLEGAAAQSTDTLMVLDELGTIEPREAQQASYGLANGAGKQRARRDGSLREPKSWRLIYLSSGEVPVEAKLAEVAGRRARAGQLVRLIDVSADRGMGFGAFDDGGKLGDAGALAQAIKNAATTAYGTAGPEFVRRLFSDGVSGEDIRVFVEQFVTTETSADADGQVKRAAERFGLIAAAGELAIEFGIVPWKEGAARQAAAWALARWIELRGGTAPIEERQAIEAVRLFIERHGEARFESLEAPEPRPVANRAGYRRGTASEREWYILPEVWKIEVCSGLDARLVAKTLADRGILRTQAHGLQSNVRIGQRTLRAYVVTPAILDGEADAR